jgi:predicted DNA-binding transcriptional regulator AlpA
MSLATAASTRAKLKAFNRFSDLKAAGLFNSRMTLDRAISRGVFPTGRVLPGGNTRIWTDDEIEAALAKCPTEKLPDRRPAKRKSAI